MTPNQREIHRRALQVTMAHERGAISHLRWLGDLDAVRVAEESLDALAAELASLPTLAYYPK